MIRYTVLWSSAAENELAEIWHSSSDRRAITEAADRIDTELKTDAHKKGFPLPDRVQAVTCGPLGAYFRIDESDRKVLVACVQLTEVN